MMCRADAGKENQFSPTKRYNRIIPAEWGGYYCLPASLLAKASGTSVIPRHPSPLSPPGGRQAYGHAAKPFIEGEPYTDGSQVHSSL